MIGSPFQIAMQSCNSSLQFERSKAEKEWLKLDKIKSYQRIWSKL